MVDATVTMVAGLHVRSCLIWQNEGKKPQNEMEEKKRNKGAELERRAELPLAQPVEGQEKRAEFGSTLSGKATQSFPPFKHKRRVRSADTCCKKKSESRD